MTSKGFNLSESETGKIAWEDVPGSFNDRIEQNTYPRYFNVLKRTLMQAVLLAIVFETHRSGA